MTALSALLNYFPVLLAGLFYYLASRCAADTGAHDGLLVLAGAMAASVLPALRAGNWIARPKAVDASDINPRDPMAGHSSPVVVFLLLFAGIAMLMGILLVSRTARAQGQPSVRPCPQLAVCFPAAHLRLTPGFATGWQLNLKTGAAAQGVVLAGGSLSFDDGKLPPFGVGLYFGSSISPDGPRYQGSVVLDVLDWVALGIGLQGFRGRDQDVRCPDGTVVPGQQRLVWQAVLSVLGKLTVGSTPGGFATARGVS